jgi:hypothetical protein
VPDGRREDERMGMGMYKGWAMNKEGICEKE